MGETSIPARITRLPPGFTVRESIYDILDMLIGVDGYSTLKTRRGSGYYEVGSLKDVWMRQVLEHNGSVGRLAEWSTHDD